MTAINGMRESAFPAQDAPRFNLAAPVQLRFSAFVRSLRANGFTIGLAESRDALRILSSIDLAQKNLMQASLRALFTSRQAEWDIFDQIFNAFWLEHGTKGTTHFEDRRRNTSPSPSSPSPTEGQNSSGTTDRGEKHDFADQPVEAEPGRNQHGGAIAQEALKTTDFRHILDREQLQRTYALAARLALKMRVRQTRRDRAARHGRRLDFRRVIHRSISRGGTPVELVFRRRKTKPLRLVMLLDTSGSMSAYTPIFVRFMHGILGSFKYASTFLFHTHLVDVTGAMTEKDPQRAIDRFSLMTAGVGGGTKIGESLTTFNECHASQVIRSRTAVIIVSDGYETGEPDLLSREMRTLHQRCRRIVWLNPMAGWQGYRPDARGMKAALPFVDFFAPAHNLESLEALEPYLARL